ncbi:MAG: alpha/beta hydrolase [Sporolactobacillus sp.]
MPTLSINRHRLFVDSQLINQDQPTLFFIHGLMTDSSEWALVRAALGPSFNSIVYDRAGHGQSEYLHPLNADQSIAEAESIFNHLPASNIHIIGSGTGAFIACALARRHPNQVTSLTLLAPYLAFQSNAHRDFLDQCAHLIAVNQPLLEQKLLNEQLSDPSGKAVQIFSHAFSRMNPLAFQKEIADMRNTSFSHFQFPCDTLCPAVPVLVLHGLSDSTLPLTLSALFSSWLPNGRLMTISSAAHLIALDQPRQTADRIASFILLTRQHPQTVLPHCQKVSSQLRHVIGLQLSQFNAPQHLLSMRIMNSLVINWNSQIIKGKWNQRYAKELLLFLILHKGSATRQLLIQTFHTMKEETDCARNELRVWINHLNQLFHDSGIPDIQDILLLGEETVAINADVSSDIGDYISRLQQFKIDRRHVTRGARQFIRLLRAYNPAIFSSFHGDWIDRLIEKMEFRLSQLMQQLIPLLKETHEYDLIRIILQEGNAVEPYDGFCEEKMCALQLHN